MCWSTRPFLRTAPLSSGVYYSQLFSDPMDCSPLGSSVHGISQARILECIAIFYSRGSSGPRDLNGVSYLVGGFPAPSCNWKGTAKLSQILPFSYNSWVCGCKHTQTEPTRVFYKLGKVGQITSQVS